MVLNFDSEELDNGQFLEKRHQPDASLSGNNLNVSMDDCIFKGKI
jgi:hypothetical protein